MRWGRVVGGAALLSCGSALLVTALVGHVGDAVRLVPGTLGVALLVLGLVGVRGPADETRTSHGPGATAASPDPLTRGAAGPRQPPDPASGVRRGHAAAAAPADAATGAPTTSVGALPVVVAACDGTAVVADASRGVLVVGDGVVARAVFRAVVLGLVAAAGAVRPRPHDVVQTSDAAERTLRDHPRTSDPGEWRVRIVGADVPGADLPAWEPVVGNGTAAAALVDGDGVPVATVVLVPHGATEPRAATRIVLDGSGCRIDGPVPARGDVMPILPPA